MVVLVDDSCPHGTGRIVKSRLKGNENLTVLFNQSNLGVGRSTIIGFSYLIEHGCEVVVKIDADGQMSPHLINDLIRPIIGRYSEACKGNRFSRIDDVLSMPKVRIVGNLVLSFMSKLSSGYWELFDPTNGFIAFRSVALKRVRLDKVDDRYFFESDLLFQCGLVQVSFSQLPMSSVYQGEESSLKPFQEIYNFGRKHARNFLKRVVYQYFLLDFNVGSLELLFGGIGVVIIILFASKLALAGVLYSRFATVGEASILTVATILTVQMLLGFFYYDATQQPLLRKIGRFFSDT